MKRIITTILVGIILVFPGGIKAQIDEAKMEKDIRVASTVLASLSQEEGQIRFYGGDRIEGNYVEGYGVIFSVNNKSIFYVESRRTGGPTFVRSGNYNNLSGTAVIVGADPDPNDKNKPKDKVEAINYEAIMVEFLANYSQMIGQLKPTDKIVISSRNADYIYSIAYKGEEIRVDESSQKLNAGVGVSAELLKKDLNDYMSGKISHDQLIAKIKVTKIDGEGRRSKDLDMFSSMLNTLYDDQYTDTYFMSRKPDYEKIKGVGAIYSVRVYSTYSDNGGFRMPALDKSDLTSDERNALVMEMYPDFVKSMKENVIQYGRTINSLEVGELLILRITLTKCDDCSMPKKIQLSVKQSVLKDFNSGKLSLQAAVGEIKLSTLK